MQLHRLEFKNSRKEAWGNVSSTGTQRVSILSCFPLKVCCTFHERNTKWWKHLTCCTVLAPVFRALSFFFCVCAKGNISSLPSKKIPQQIFILLSSARFGKINIEVFFTAFWIFLEAHHYFFSPTVSEGRAKKRWINGYDPEDILNAFFQHIHIKKPSCPNVITDGSADQIKCLSIERRNNT